MILAVGAFGPGIQEPDPAASGPGQVEIRWTIRPVSACLAYLFEGPFGELGRVAWDPVADEVWVSDSSRHRIGILDPDLFPKFSFGSREAIPHPRHLLIASNGDVLTLFSYPNTIRIFNYRGDWRRDLVVSADGEDLAISSLDQGRDGLLLVGDGRGGRLLAVDPGTGRSTWTLGEWGQGPGKFLSINGAAYSPDGQYLYVLDGRGEPAVQVFGATDREFLFGWGEHNLGRSNFSTPADLEVAPSGLVLVADTLRHVVKVFDSEGSYVMMFGGLGSRPGDLAYPIGLAITEAHVVYVAEKIGRRVQRFQIFREARSKIPPQAPSGQSKSLRGSILPPIGLPGDASTADP